LWPGETARDPEKWKPVRSKKIKFKQKDTGEFDQAG
jgi:hypothetical protein